jgi:hypothetical protein
MSETGSYTVFGELAFPRDCSGESLCLNERALSVAEAPSVVVVGGVLDHSQRVVPGQRGVRRRSVPLVAVGRGGSVRRRATLPDGAGESPLESAPGPPSV